MLETLLHAGLIVGCVYGCLWMVATVIADNRRAWLDLCIWASRRRHGGFER